MQSRRAFEANYGNSSETMEPRRRSGHCRVRGDVSGHFGLGCWNNSDCRVECEQCILKRCQFTSINWSDTVLARGESMKDLLLQLARPYRCTECGKDIAFRSRPRTFAERYILPLILMQPVRCAECFRRDYRSIFTSVYEHHGSASIDRKAA